MKCSICSESLDGELDTFGDLAFPLCWDCYAEMNSEGEAVYGLGPHHHDLSKTGSLIGSTVFDELPEKNEAGEYIVDGDVFVPDPGVPGLGVWIRKGWRWRRYLT